MRQYLRAHLNVDDRNVSSQATLKLHVLRGTHTNRHTRTIKHACCVSRRMFFLRLVDILNFGKKPGEMSSPLAASGFADIRRPPPLLLNAQHLFLCVVLFLLFFAGMLAVKTYILQHTRRSQQLLQSYKVSRGFLECPSIPLVFLPARVNCPANAG